MRNFQKLLVSVRKKQILKKDKTILLQQKTEKKVEKGQYTICQKFVQIGAWVVSFQAEPGTEFQRPDVIGRIKPGIHLHKKGPGNLNFAQ